MRSLIELKATFITCTRFEHRLRVIYGEASLSMFKRIGWNPILLCGVQQAVWVLHLGRSSGVALPAAIPESFLSYVLPTSWPQAALAPAEDAIVAGDLGARTLDNNAIAGRVLSLTNPTGPQFRVLPYAPRTTHWGNQMLTLEDEANMKEE
ncbi:hypothetical protein PCANC_05574 [Puccinia coronata f. sp. avenae]|uniref:Uncharacterized protein n=1 Tax=Puccinia coronata f. sp. avenae TaxID=200324 RepID=A0A2N5VP56_9BASI|nr:hypothetical protein PCANC_25657 [Puccinia coronata f. sp. avenae]PLW14478.1 hypothetical protein PCANC_15150 [Puccinia coronata f. sp. avenae]PLW51781.1 hypothetical protein PCANC_05574 [Puccinia coronata f. sp. avenae]